MSRNLGARSVLVLALLAATVVAPALAQVAEVAVSPTTISFQPQVEYARLVLTVSGGDKWVRMEFGPGETPSLNIFDAAGEALADGTYAWELRATPRVESLKPSEYANPRMSADGSSYEEGRVPQGQVQSGYFTILDGAVVSPDLVEPGPDEMGAGESNPFQEVVLTNADGVIRNSLCVGFDCPNSPAFGFTTILMMENNTRILFDDTSTLSGFPNADWQLTANDSASGGANKFSIEETSAGRIPFTIRGGAPSNSLFVDSGGRIGRRTATPVLEFHIVDGDSPSIRLEQDNSSGFTPQTWDIAGNETNFFVRDATGGSALPFRIRPGSPGNSIFINTNGDVGFGTSSPSQELHIRRTDANATGLVLENANATAQNVIFDMTNPGGSWRFRAQSTGNFEIIDNDLSITRLSIGSGGLVSINGGLTIGGVCSDSDGGIGGAADGCDRVFRPDYPLPTIQEHAAEMWEKGYLPAVGPTPDGEQISLNVFQKTTGILNELEKAHIYIEQLLKRIDGLEGRVAELEGSGAEE